VGSGKVTLRMRLSLEAETLAKSALTLALCEKFRDTHNIGECLSPSSRWSQSARRAYQRHLHPWAAALALTSVSVATGEDQEFLIRNKALEDEGRIRSVETGECFRHLLRISRRFPGGCPHAAIREDISANLHVLEQLQADYACEMLFVESGGDNLAGG
jgi:urease accessory protein